MLRREIIAVCKEGSQNCEKAIISFVMTVRLSDCPSILPRGTTRFPMEGYSLCLILEHSSKICPEYATLGK